MKQFITVHSDNGKNKSMVNIDFIVSVVEYEGKNYLTVKGIENPALIDETIAQVEHLIYGTSPPTVQQSATFDLDSLLGATTHATVEDEDISKSIVGPG